MPEHRGSRERAVYSAQTPLCEVCSRPIVGRRRDSRFCSETCRDASGGQAVVCARVNIDLARWLDEYAAALGMTRNALIVHTLHELRNRTGSEDA